MPLKFSELFQVLSILGSLSALMRLMNVNMEKVLYSIMVMIMIIYIYLKHSPYEYALMYFKHFLGDFSQKAWSSFPIFERRQMAGSLPEGNGLCACDQP